MLKRITELRKIISEHNHRYYVLFTPIISDFEFDQLMKELIKLEAENPDFFDKNSPTQRVGSDSKISGFNQIKHNTPMLSLANTYSVNEVFEFMTKLNNLIGRKLRYYVSLKFDGASSSIIYEKGEYVRAATRGDGNEGDDVTENVRTIKNIPLKLNVPDVPDYFELRGEIVLLHKNFDKANILRVAEGDKAFVNPRNAASGTLKSYTSSNVAKIGLSFMPFKMICDDYETGSHASDIGTVYDLGFEKSPYYIIESDFSKIEEFINKMDSVRKTLPFDIDGLVIMVDDTALHEFIGYTAKSPNYATSYKFKAEQLPTKLLSIDYQVGRTGAITPVANLQPIFLAGTTVKRASLHNADQIALLDIRLNDIVLVEKGGEIIPKVVGVDLSERDVNSVPTVFITNCPECGSVLYKDPEYAKHYCLNKSGCKPQIIGMVDHFFSKDAVKIEIGEATIAKLVEKGIVKSIPDMYKLNLIQLLSLDGFAEPSAKKLLAEIEESKKHPFERVLYGLGISDIGKTVSKRLIEAGFDNIDKIKKAKYNDLVNIPNVGDGIASKIIEWFDNVDNLIIIEDLKSFGLNMEVTTIKTKGDKLKGLSFVFSGTFPIDRDDLKNMIEENGGEIKSSVSSKLNYFIVGDGVGPSKLEKANSIKSIKQITYQEFLNLL